MRLSCLLALAVLCAPGLGRAEDAAAAGLGRDGTAGGDAAVALPGAETPADGISAHALAQRAFLSGVLLAQAEAPSQPAGAQQAPPPSLDFDLLDDAAKKPDAAAQAADAERIDRMVRTRRTMLTLHQGLGIATLASLVGTTVVGQLAFNDKYRGGGDTERFLPWHVGLLITTSALFTTVGLLGVLAPVPYEKHFRWDTANIHKMFMALATAGMVAQLVLGLVTHGLDGQLSQVDLATAHQVIGYATLGAMTAGTVTLFF